MELSNFGHPQSSGCIDGSKDRDSESGVLVLMPSESESSENLTAEELLYLKVYQDKVLDAGFAEGGCPPASPPPWQLRHRSPILTQLRIIRWLAFFVSFAVAAGTGIYLLIATIQVQRYVTVSMRDLSCS
jgi:hypothetical protein